MPVSIDRIRHDITMLAGFTETPGAGVSRPTFSPAWRQARDYLVAQLEQAGCNWRIDAAGNLHARHRAIAWESPVWLSGSHLDTASHGGSFDGAVGVVAALEVIRASDKKIVPLELVVWAEEEGAAFGRGMVGSRAWVGELSVEQLGELRNSAGQNWFEAGAEHGVDAQRLPQELVKPHQVVGMIEVHVEQGPGLWNEGHAISVVTAIAGRRQYRCTITGSANHAGTTAMLDRSDALAGAAEMITSIESYARSLGSHAVATVGQIHCEPNAINLIPGKVTFTIDFRSAATGILAPGDKALRRIIEDIAAKRVLGVSIEATETIPAIEMHTSVCGRIIKAAQTHDISIPQSTSGARHDAAVLAAHVPTAMIFVASRGGISHNPDEFSRMEDIVAATTVLAEAVRDRRID